MSLNSTLDLIQVRFYAIGAQLPTPGPARAPDQLQAKATTALGLGSWIVGVACIVGIMACAVAMAVSHRQGGVGEHGSKIGAVAVACLIGASASAIVGFLFG